MVLGNRSNHHRTYIGFLERGERCPTIETRGLTTPFNLARFPLP